MAKKITNTLEFLKELKKLLQVFINCSPVLFGKKFRKKIKLAWKEAQSLLEERIFSEESKENNIRLLDNSKLEAAGLTGAQRELKFYSFSASIEAFEEEGFTEDLEAALEKGGIILKSISGVIPGFGTFAQELIDFILQERIKRKRKDKR